MSEHAAFSENESAPRVKEVGYAENTVDGPRSRLPSVAHFASYLDGGAGIAAYRLHEGLRASGAGSRFYYGSGTRRDDTTIPAFQNGSFLWRNIAALYMSYRNWKMATGAFVTSPRWVRQTRLEALGPPPDVINLHWVAKWLDLPSFFESVPASIPIVWSLHDLIPITGGCHYPGECDRFIRECGDCPQLRRPSPHDDTYRFLKLKKALYGGRNLHFVANSEWTAARARESALMGYAQSLHTIPYGLNIEEHVPIDRGAARHALRIREDRFVIGFASTDLSEPRKGAADLLEALQSPPLEETTLLTFGSGLLPAGLAHPVVALGPLSSPNLQSLFYSAVDAFVTPSRVETFGNTALEAMACGTVVLAYAAGGLSEVIADGQTGMLEPDVGNVAGLVRMLNWIREHPEERASMGRAARQRVERYFSHTLMAERYSQLYQTLLRSSLASVARSAAERIG